MTGAAKKAVLAVVLAVATGLGAAGAAKQHKKVAHPVVWPEWKLLLGGTVNGKWRESYEIGPVLEGGERYRLYDLTRCLGSATGTKPKRNEDFGYQEMELSPLPKSLEGLIAVGGEWNGLPRVPRALPLDGPVYREAVAALLKTKGIAKPDVTIRQLLRVDLEGDGPEEVLITAGLQVRNQADWSRAFGFPRGGGTTRASCSGRSSGGK
jgi:hypothetical protein